MNNKSIVITKVHQNRKIAKEIYKHSITRFENGKCNCFDFGVIHEKQPRKNALRN